MRILPKVSAYCATYGRVHLLEEAVYSFLIQDYQGPKELIILNDFPKQQIYFDHPEVKVYNLKEKINILGKKFNETVKYCTGEIIFPWEDDDVYLPHKLRTTVNKLLTSNKKIFHAQQAFYELSKGNIIKAVNYFGHDLTYHVNMAMYKTVFDNVSGYYIADGVDLDITSMDRFFQSQNYQSERLNDNEIFYIYRLNSTNSYHGTWLGHEPEGQSKECEKYINSIMHSIPTGDYYLNPHWDFDYDKICKKLFENNLTAN